MSALAAGDRCEVLPYQGQVLDRHLVGTVVTLVGVMRESGCWDCGTASRFWNVAESDYAFCSCCLRKIPPREDLRKVAWEDCAFRPNVLETVP